MAKHHNAELIQQYFGSKGFGDDMDRLMQAVNFGVPVDVGERDDLKASVIIIEVLQNIKTLCGKGYCNGRHHLRSCGRATSISSSHDQTFTHITPRSNRI